MPDGYDLKITTTKVEDLDFRLDVSSNNGQQSCEDFDILRVIKDIDVYHRGRMLTQKTEELQMTSRVCMGSDKELYSGEHVTAYVNARMAEEILDYAGNHNKRDVLRLANNFLSILQSYEQIVPESVRTVWHDFSRGRNLANGVIKASEKIAGS